jgi:hypothetical protein
MGAKKKLQGPDLGPNKGRVTSKVLTHLLLLGRNAHRFKEATTAAEPAVVSVRKAPVEVPVYKLGNAFLRNDLIFLATPMTQVYLWLMTVMAANTHAAAEQSDQYYAIPQGLGDPPKRTGYSRKVFGRARGSVGPSQDHCSKQK